MPLAAVLNTIFFVAAGVTALISVMLYYHWVRYGMTIVGTLLVMVIYGLGTALILTSMLGLIAQV